MFIARIFNCKISDTFLFGRDFDINSGRCSNGYSYTVQTRLMSSQYESQSKKQSLVNKYNEYSYIWTSGAGKGTQSKFIVKKFNLYQLSTGDLLRNEVKNKTELGLKISSIMNSGQLVSDEIVGNLIEKFVSNNKYKNKIIFDGYQEH